MPAQLCNYLKIFEPGLQGSLKDSRELRVIKNVGSCEQILLLYFIKNVVFVEAVKSLERAIDIYTDMVS